jgi:hypothetical protein
MVVMKDLYAVAMTAVIEVKQMAAQRALFLAGKTGARKVDA